MHILYVEDNETNQALVGRVVRARQHLVTFREEGEAALKVLEEDATIGLILLDVELAGTMTGLDCVRALRARGDRRPVVAVTAYAMMGDRERILEAGCDGYLPKPLVVPDLLALLDHYEAELSKASTPAPQPATAPTPAAPQSAAASTPAAPQSAAASTPAAPQPPNPPGSAPQTVPPSTVEPPKPVETTHPD
ncbi:MAG: response regulator [Chloroflexi bacterium]|nr:response regulator [Chloroflexota bacterium]